MTRSKTPVLALVLLAAASAPLAGQELFCSATNQQLKEAWPNFPTGGPACANVSYRDLKFEVHTGSTQPALGFSIIPFLPMANCAGSNMTSTTFFDLFTLNLLVDQGTISAEEVPGVQSIVRAAKSWNDVPDSRLQFDLTPTFVSSGAVHVCQVFPPNCPGWGFDPGAVSTTLPPCSSPGNVPVSSISAFEPAMMPPNVLAFTPVSVDLTTGQIVDADILLQPLVQWYEANDYQAKTYLSNWSGGQTSTMSATDLEGVLTHEFGHFAGLGHSLIDSTHNDGSDPVGRPLTMPTMFWLAQTTTLESETAWFGHKDSLCGEDNAQISGEIVAREARTLQAEDQAMLGRTYPAASFLMSLGSVQGRVLRDGNDANPGSGTPAPGCHVVAIRKDDPNGTRIGVLSLTNGAYRLDGLPPGEYYLFVESVDWDVAFGTSYFQFAGLPAWLTKVIPGTTTLDLDDCNDEPFPGPASFPMDIYNGFGEAFDEGGQLHAAQTVTINPGSNLIGADFRIQTITGTTGSQQDILTLTRNGGTASARGLLASFNPADGVLDVGSPGGSITFQVDEPDRPDSLVAIGLTWSRANLELDGQLLQGFNAAAIVLPQGVPGISALPGIPFVGVLDGNGSATFTYPLLNLPALQNDHRYMNVFAQAFIADQDPLGELVDVQVGNVVNIWFTR
jgi:hypothetical protein